MSITADALIQNNGTPDATSVRIVGWVDEVPKHRRTTPFDEVVAELVRMGDPARIAVIEWEGREITPNKVNSLRKKYPNCEWTQVSEADKRVTYVRLRTPAEVAAANEAA